MSIDFNSDSFNLVNQLTTNQRQNVLNCNPDQFATLFKVLLSQHSKFRKNLFIFNSTDEAYDFYGQIKDHNTFYYPDIGSNVYSSMSISLTNLEIRFNIIQHLLSSSSVNIVTSLESAQLYLPPLNFFRSQSFRFQVDDIIPQDELSSNLIKLGFKRLHEAHEPGTFAVKGEVFDIFPVDFKPVRLIYFDELIEHIYPVDPDSLRADRTKGLTSVEIKPTVSMLLQDEYINQFKSSLPRQDHTNVARYNNRKEILRRLNDAQFFDNFPLYLKYFFKNNYNLFSYTKDFNHFNFTTSSFDFTNINQGDYEHYTDSDVDVFLPPPQDIYFDSVIPSDLLSFNFIEHSDSAVDINLNLHSINHSLLEENEKYISSQEMKNSTITKFISKCLDDAFNVVIFYSHSKSKDEISFILENSSYDIDLLKVNFIHTELATGLFLPESQLLILSEFDFFSRKTKKHKSKNELMESDLFAEQLATLAIGDFVVHKDHGVGKYLGIETLSMGGSTSDYILLEYQDRDKIYVPVYKMSLLQKHASHSTSIKLANLKTNKFDIAKSKARKAVQKLAFDLLQLEAKRSLLKSHSFSPPDHIYKEFELAFPFEETPDQERAIENIIKDMTSPRPMNRLVCGDVGFGKTEVAMRASFLAVLDHKQVAILVPTTVLALQHYNSFQKRFKDFPVNIDFISRFKTAKESSEILSKLSQGKIDILIGTHKLLSSKIKFNDLGLVIIDEEQRFGVAHKEKLKLFRETIDTLTLTATPIPRTLQQSFMGIKELSLIKTPPPKRQSIRSYIIKEDKTTLRLALEKELQRGGQSFVVHNRVSDIENYTTKIRSLVPQAKIVYAHGQMPEKQLEKIISDFYNHKYDILVSTTIIESGIDIPKANTLIIDRADTYGLSQLHQLRGRIGRSDVKAYAYFVVPSNNKLSEVAAKRIKAIQTYSEIGAGFALATSDLEIRGSGDILGPEQSGHINDIGLELYTELLKEAVSELKGETIVKNETIEISSPFDSYLPSNYIPTPSTRIKFYKLLSNSNSVEEVNGHIEAIEDRFGESPAEVQNLAKIIQSKVYLNGIGLQSIKVKKQSILLKFSADHLSSHTQTRDQVISFFSQRPNIYKLNPDYSINCIFKDTISIDTLLEFAQHIANNIKIN